MSKLGKFAAACAAVVCGFGANVAQAEVPATYYKTLRSTYSSQTWTVLDWTPKGDSAIETKLQISDTYNGRDIFNAHGASRTDNAFSFRYDVWDKYSWAYGDKETTVTANSASTISRGAVLNLKFNAIGGANNGVSIWQSAPKAFTAGNKMMLFANYTNGSGETPVASGSYGDVTLYNFLGFDDNGETLKVKLYPCKDANGKPGLYDLVSRKIYYNLGTGAKDFTVATEVPGPRAEINVLSADGRRYGTVSPAYGTTEGVDGETYAFTAPAEAVSVGGSSGVRATCTGWKLYSAADNTLLKSSEDEGESATSFTHTFSTNVGAIVEWQWKKAYRFTAEKVGGGVVSSDAETEWFDAETDVTVEATPAEGYEFIGWSGVPEGQRMDNPVTLTAGATPVRLVASFAPTAAGEQTAVYVRADALPGGDGTCWARALSDFNAAVTAANELKLPVYAAKGVYTLTGVCSVTDLPAIYGGFSGTDDAETVADRQVDVNRTVLNGDKTMNNYWCHVEPGAVGSYAHTKTALLGRPLFVDGELQMPPAFTADYDTYIPNLDTTDTSAALSITATAAGTIDGLWFAGFCGSSNAIVTYNSGTKAMNLVNCRFIGNTSMYGSVRNNDATTKKNLIGCKFLHTGVRVNTAMWGDASVVAGVNLGGSDGAMSLDGCEFRSLAAMGTGNQYDVLLGSCCLKCSHTYHYQFPLRATIRGCTFARNFVSQRDTANRKGGDNVLGEGNYYSGIRYVDCMMSNCLTVVSRTASTPPTDFGRACCEMTGCSFIRNRHDQKAGTMREFVFLGGSGESCRQFYNACSFVGNEYNVTDSSVSDGTVRVALFATPTDRQQKSAFVNCVFDDNKVTAKVQDGVSTILCRGVMAYCTTANLASETSIAGCTFVGPRIEGVKDIVMYNATYNKTLNIVDSIFEYLGGEPYDGFDFMNPASARLYSCTLANWVRPDVEYAIEGHTYDYVPFVTNLVGAMRRPVLVPAANPPHLRETADLAYNGATFSQPVWMTNFAFRAYGSESWQALTPSAKALDADVSRNPSKYVCTDAAGTVRPYGATTRGAVQTMTDEAENGVTLTLRREPFDKGVLAGPQVQAVATGAATVPVTATATDPVESPFVGWYDENDDLFSPDATLSFGSLDRPLTLTAKFAAKKTKVIFDLGEHATFDETGLHTNVIELAQGADFPEVPPYTVDEGWVFANWKPAFPISVPAYDVAFTAKVVTTSLRTMRVAADSTAAEPDGLSWETAYRSVADAYADAAICRGEVWIKEGRHVVSGVIPLKSNVTVRGGFAGGEESAAESDPAAHPTVITGDTQLNDYWKYKTSGTASLWKDGVPVGPEPDRGDNCYATCVNAADDTVRCFSDENGAVTNVAFHGLTFACFGREAVRCAQGTDAVLVVSNCQFFACSGVGAGDSYAVTASGRRLELLDGRFVGNCGAVSVSGGSTTSVIARCVFDANYRRGNGVAGVAISGAHAATVAQCEFRRTYAYQESYFDSVGSLHLSPSDGWTVEVSDCSVVSNTVQGLPRADVLKNGNGSAIISRCRFDSIRFTSGGQNMWTQVFVGNALRNSGGDLLVRDSAFSHCSAVPFYGTSSRVAATILGFDAGVTTFVNDTFDDCSATTTTEYPVGIFAQRGTGGKVGIVNCLFNGTKTVGDRAGFFATDGEAASTSFNVINSAIVNSAEGFKVAYLWNNAACLGFADSVVDGFDADALPSGSNGYAYNVTTNTAVAVGDLKQGENGAWARAVTSEKRGRRVWLKGTTVYFRDDVANPAKPWRKAADKSFFAAEVDGLDASTLIPDAFGKRRISRRAFFGPAFDRPGLMLIVR